MQRLKKRRYIEEEDEEEEGDFVEEEATLWDYSSLFSEEDAL